MSKKNKNVSSYSSDSDEMIRMLKVLGAVLVIFAAFYFVFAVINGEIRFGKKATEEVEIQDVEIIAGETFNRGIDSYYVLMYDFGSDESIKLSSLYDLYTSVNGSKKIFIVNLAKKFSSKYVTEKESEINVKDIEHLKVKGPILIKVENEKGVSYTLGADNIEKTLFNK
ncbi:MAG: hypothetical protein IKO78_04195 [Bacilli bacterium]|nr:hypothetical protein [Bacilli bacterium]